MRKLALALTLCLPGWTACDGGTGFKIPRDKDLKPGGVFVAYNNGCAKGCDQVAKGDLIQSVDGKPLKTGKDLDDANVTDGKSHKLEILSAGTHEKKTVLLEAVPKTTMPPIAAVPPFWTVGAEQLNAAPDWARRRMFGHASPMVMLVNIDGGILDGRQLYGKKHFMVYWDQGSRQEQAMAVTFLKVLQKAQGDLTSRGIDILFTQVRFPTGRQAPMNDSDLRAFQQKWSEKGSDGAPLPPLPTYRFPNAVEFNEARQLGMESAYTVFENLGESPTLLLLDERGIVRWHSEGIAPVPPGAEIADPIQYTIIEAVKFALEKL